MADPGEGSGGGGAPLFLDQTETQRGEKFFLETGTIEYTKYKDFFGKAYFCQYFDDAYYQKLTYKHKI